VGVARTVSEDYLRRGLVSRPVADPEALAELRERVVITAARLIGEEPPVDVADHDHWLETIHHRIDLTQLNDLKVALMARLGHQPEVRRGLHAVARPFLDELIGPELAVQRRPNVSVHLSGAGAEALPVHADTWSGHSPFEVVVWVPLVSCRRTQAMYALERPADAVLRRDLARRERPDAESLFAQIASAVTWVEVDYGDVVMFDPGLVHGSRPNEEPATRWSFNCRFKAVFSPYGDKGLGDYFEPVGLSPVTRVALGYRHHGVG
jgi:sporadic carbohydrate cluster 2OG-Fe(II) oxygenase